MGTIIDMEKVDDNVRCQDVKKVIIWINLIAPPISFFLLLFAIIRMFCEKRKSFLSILILIIFISEAVQSISKLLQLVKYIFDDERDNKKITDFNRPRSVICQIQILLAISSDFCSLLTTLLLTLRCYDLIKHRRKFFDRGNNQIIFIILDIVCSVILAIVLLLFDKYVFTKDNISYRYDVRDRCSYWCWLEHYSSLGCFGLYVIILIAIIIFALISFCDLKKGFNNLKRENDFSRESIGLDDLGVQSQATEMEGYEENNKFNMSREDKKKLRDLKLMMIKNLVYPIVTIIYWVFAATYRIVDDSKMMQFDIGDDPDALSKKEIEYFHNHPSFKRAVQSFLVLFTFFSSIRGILYGFSFMAFDEKIFFNLFKRSCKCCLKFDNLEDEDDDECKDEIEKQRDTDASNDLIEENDNYDKNKKKDDDE